MKILHIFKVANPKSIGGVETVIDALADAFKHNTDAAVEVIATHQDRDEVTLHHNGYKVHFFPANFTIAATQFAIRMLVWCIKNIRKYDVIYLHYPYPFGDALCLLLHRKTKLIILYHADIINKSKVLHAVYSPLERLTMRRANTIIGTSPQYMQTSAVLNRHQHKSVCIPLAIDDITKDTRNKPKSDFDFSKPFFLFVGALRSYKGLDTLLKAGKETGYPILIVGDGDERKRLHAQKRDNNLGNVFFTGSLSASEKAYCYSKAYALTFPSNMRSEAFGITLLEASAFGLPMITCEIGTGTSFVNLKDKTGLIVPPNDAEAFGGAMRRLMENPNLREQMGTAARQRYLSLFTPSNFNTAHRALLEN